MKENKKCFEEKYEVIIRRCGDSDPVETDVLGERETQAVLYMIGRLQGANA